MGLILDSSVAIAAERRRMPVEDMLSAIRELTGPEVEHRIWRAKEPAQATRRQRNVPVYPVTTDLARRLTVSMPSSKPEAFGSRSFCRKCPLYTWTGRVLGFCAAGELPETSRNIVTVTATRIRD